MSCRELRLEHRRTERCDALVGPGAAERYARISAKWGIFTTYAALFPVDLTMQPKKTFALGVYTFGNTPRTADGGYGATAQAIRDALEAVHVAEEVGLDFFGFGEHHTRSMPVSSPTSLVNAAAASTHDIKLGTTVTVLSTDEPVRVFEPPPTAAAIAPGRID